MTAFWDQRIARAKKLSTHDSPAREILSLYIKVADFQRKVSHGLNGAEHPDIRSLLRFLPELKKLVKDLGSAPLQAATERLANDAEGWTDLLMKHWEPDSEASSPADACLASLLLQPYAQHVTARMNISSGNDATQCPACGNPPQLSLWREFNNGAKRSLVCSLCSTEWEFRRVFCPYCKEQNKDKLPLFTADEFQQARIEACDSCQSYIKCIDLTRDGHAVPPVDDLATLAFDLWAHEQGYTRRYPNMFLLPSE
ncbi:MAG TPA: formate dehydrogenase accessory protein FdhE [Candidatus Angelobacter sp.]